MEEAAARKARLPTVESLTDGTMRRSDDCRCTEEVGLIGARSTASTTIFSAYNATH